MTMTPPLKILKPKSAEQKLAQGFQPLMIYVHLSLPNLRPP